MEFMKKHNHEVDIFCLQEVFHSDTFKDFRSKGKINLLDDLRNLLTDYNYYFAPKSIGYDYSGSTDIDVAFGNVIFIKKDIKVELHEEIFGVIDHPGHDWKDLAIGKAQFVKFAHNDKDFVVCNFHGLWKYQTNKTDIPMRAEQSQLLKSTLNNFSGEKILAGDFNLVPDGQSIKVLEEGMKNLITEYGITSTRSSLYDKDIKFADYVLVTDGIDVKNFEVLPEEVSDHLALFVDFS